MNASKVLTLMLVIFLDFLCKLTADEPPGSEILQAQPGHSIHSEAFNEGPRQAAYLMNGMGNVHWEISTKNPMAQRFFDQGITQLHGFWYFEAERSFRQAAAFDTDCAILYWGMARANIENPWRSKGFIEQAMKKIEKAPEKEKRLVEAWNNRVKDSKASSAACYDSKPVTTLEKKAMAQAKKREDETGRKDQQERLTQYVRAIETIAYDFPDDIEIKAMLVLQYWQNNGSGIDIQSHFAINAILADIFHSNPKHPAHHFRIHLWDYKKESLAIDAAAKCGPSAPGIAHMWHMPGHTYSRLHRYADAAWQQEASARVDHAHMMRDQVMPDQIHNYAHNNEWLIRDLMLLGRVREALELAKNMIELPRHPRYNALNGRGSASLGRERLLGVLTSYRLWPQLVELANSVYLEATSEELKQDERNAWLAIANSQSGEMAKCKKIQDELTSLLVSLRSNAVQGRETLRLLAEADSHDTKKAITRPPKLLEPYPWSEEPFGEDDDPSTPKMPSREIDDSIAKDWTEERKEKANNQAELEFRIAKLNQLRFAVDAYVAASEGQFIKALEHSHQCRPIINSTTRIEWLAQAGNPSKALDRIKKRIEDGPGELLPLAIGVWIASQNNLQDENVKSLAKGWTELLSPIAAMADPNVALLDRIVPAIESIGEKQNWRVPGAELSDVGDRPSLDSLGPFRWQPSLAPIWSATDSTGETKSSKQFARRPLVLILYLGFGCVHCAEQLKEFSPMVKPFHDAGIDVTGISTETLTQLQNGLRNYDAEMKLTLMANPEVDIFKAFRCYDDFEGLPLHGTFLIDANGRIRWQDIGYKPFMDPKFLLDESTRLLKL